MTTSKTQFVYLQRPDNGEWVTVGRFQTGPAAGTGRFKYAPNYVGAGLAWSIDPVNLPFRPEDEQPVLQAMPAWIPGARLCSRC
jgi:serine/threonine-protein kinase HipA